MLCDKKIGLNIDSGSLIVTSSRTVEDRIAVSIFRDAGIRRKITNNFLFFFFFASCFSFLSFFSFLCLSYLMFLLFCLGFWCSRTVHNFCEVDRYIKYPMLVLHGIQIADFMLKRKLIKMYYPAQFCVQRLHAAGYPVVTPTFIFEQKPMKYIEIN